MHFELLRNVHILLMKSHFIFAIASERASIACELFDVQMFLIDVQRELTISARNFTAMRTDAFTIVDNIIALWQVNVPDVSCNVELGAGGEVANVTLKVFHFGVHAANVQWNFPLFGELFVADGALFAAR